MASIGDALIYSIPFFLLVVLVFFLFNEIYFFGSALMNETVLKEEVDFTSYEDNCFVSENSFKKFCKSDFGFFGWKQWVNAHDQQFIENSIDDFVSKEFDSDNLCKNGMKSITVENYTFGGDGVNFIIRCVEP